MVTPHNNNSIFDNAAKAAQLEFLGFAYPAISCETVNLVYTLPMFVLHFFNWTTMPGLCLAFLCDTTRFVQRMHMVVELLIWMIISMYCPILVVMYNPFSGCFRRISVLKENYVANIGFWTVYFLLDLKTFDSASRLICDYYGYLVGIEPNPGPEVQSAKTISENSHFAMDRNTYDEVFRSSEIYSFEIVKRIDYYLCRDEKIARYKQLLRACTFGEARDSLGLSHTSFGLTTPVGFICVWNSNRDVWKHTAACFFSYHTRSNILSIRKADVVVLDEISFVQPSGPFIAEWGQPSFITRMIGKISTMGIDPNTISAFVQEQVDESLVKIEDTGMRLIGVVGLSIICVAVSVNGVQNKDKLKITGGIAGLVIIAARFNVHDTVKSLMDYLSSSEAQAESPIMAEMSYDLIKNIIMQLTGFSGKLTHTTKYFQLLNAFSTAAKNLPELLTWFTELFDYIINLVWHSVLGKDRITLGFTKDAELQTWVKAVNAIFDENDSVTLKINGDNARRIQRLLARGRSFLMESNHLPQILVDKRKRVVSQFLSELQRLYEPYKSAMVFGQDLRMEPLAIFINGAPGTGKTLGLKFVIDQIVGQCLDPSASSLHGDMEDSIFMRAAEGKYWSGYRNQFAVVFDDFGQARDIAGNPDNEYMDLIRAVSMFGNPLHMAAIAEKGTTFFTSEVIIATSNMRNFRSVNSINCREALERRFKINVTLAPSIEFSYDGNVPWNERRLNIEKVTEFNRKLGRPDGFFCLEAYEFHVFNWPSQIHSGMVTDEADPQYTGEVLNWGNFLQLVIVSFQKQRQKFSDIVESAKYFRAELRKDKAKFTAEGAIDEVVDDSDLLNGDDDSDDTDDLAWRDLTLDEINILLTNEDTTMLSHYANMYNVNLRTRFPRGGFQSVFDDTFFEQYFNFAKSPPMLLIKNLSVDKYNRLIDLATKYGEHRILNLAIDYLACWGRQRQVIKNVFGERGSLLEEFESYLLGLSEWFNRHVTSNKWLNVLLVSVTFSCTLTGIVSLVAKAFTSFGQPSASCLQIIFEQHNELSNQQDLRDFCTREMICPSWPEAERNIAESIIRLIRKFAWKSEVEAFSVINILFDNLLEKRSSRWANDHVIAYDATGRSFGRGEVVSGVEVAKAESGIDKNGFEIIASIRKYNQYEIFANDVRLGTVTFVRDRFALLPAHFILFIRNKIRELGQCKVHLLSFDNRVNYPIDSQFVASLDLGHCRLGDSDVALVEFPRYIRGHADQVGKFISSLDELKSIRRLNSVLSVHSAGDTRHYASNAVYREGSIPMNLGNGTIYGFTGYIEYQAETAGGDCGSLLWRHDKSVNTKKILGFHVASLKSMDVAIATVITQDMLLSKISSGIIHPDVGVPTAECGFEGPFVPLQILNRGLISGSKTSLRKSVFYGKLWPSIKSPAKLRPFADESGELIDPMAKALARFNRPLVIIDPDDITIARDSVYADISNAERHPIVSREYTFSEAVAGIPGDKFIGAIPRNTSPGWPKVNEVTPDFPGKTRWFGKGEDYDLTRPECLELERECSDVISSAKRGVRSLHIFSDHLKDEKVSHEKSAIGKTRLFCGSPLVLLICIRMYFLDFVASLMTYRISNGSAIGVNPYQEWGFLYSSLQKFSDHIVAGDFSSFDVSQTAQLLWAVYDIIDRWYRERGATEESCTVRRVLWEEVVNSVHINGKLLYMWIGSLPSGLALTTVVNTLYNNMIVKIAAFRASGRDMKFFSQISSFVKPVAYGDDGIMAIKHSIISWFNQNALTRELALCGMTYTDETKSADGVTAPYSVIYGRTFLKRTFAKRYELEDRIVGPLELDSIREMILWTKKGPFEYSTQCSNVDFVLRELALHGSEIYQEYAPKILDISRRFLNYVPTITNYILVLRSTLDIEEHY